MLKKKYDFVVYDQNKPEYVKGNFTVNHERRKRPLKVTQKIEEREESRESAVLHPICCYSPVSRSYEETPAPFGAGGHLIASILGGSNDPENLVPVSNRFNGQMKTKETEIRNFIKGDEIIEPELTVEVTEYHQQDGRIPKSVKYTLSYKKLKNTGNKIKKPKSTYSTRGNASVEDMEVDEIVELTLSHDFGTITQDFLVICDNNKRHTQLIAFLNNLEQEMKTNLWKVEDDYPIYASDDFKKVAPNRRPYAVLDYWFLKKDGKGYTPHKDQVNVKKYEDFAATYKNRIDKGVEFSDDQKALMLRVHYARNNGYLKSDAYGKSAQQDTGIPIFEPHDGLIHGAAGNGPSFDHICPVDKKGANLFSNCQLTSIAFNSRKGKKF